MRFGEKSIQALRAGPKPRDYLATNYKGLILRVSLARGQTRKVFRYRYWRPGNKKSVARYVTLGEYPALSLGKAVSLQDDCRQAIEAGGDPAAVVRAYWERNAPDGGRPPSDGPTVRDVVNEFLEYAGKKRARPEQARYLLEANVLPILGDKPAADVRKRDIVTLLDDIVARGSPVTANRVQALLKQAFAVAADRDLIEAVPTFPREAAGGAEAPRTRVLSDAEIRHLWHGLDKVDIPRPLALALKLQLVTAQRRGEIAAAKFSDIRDGVWHIPQTKNQRPHAIPLPGLAVELIGELRELAGKSDHWLPSARGGAAADRERTITRAAREARKALEMDEWTPHDLRRTARTGMARLGVSDAVAERVLNHVAGDRMVQVYNQHRYIEEMREALDKWAAHLAGVVA